MRGRVPDASAAGRRAGRPWRAAWIVRLQRAVRIADQDGMATISAFRSAAALLGTLLVLAARPSAADPLRAPQPVAYYDVDAVVREAHALAPQWRRVAAVEERYVAESASLRAEVNELRTLLADRAVVDPQRRVFETQLAERTIALLVLRSDGMHEVAQAKASAVDDVEQRIAAAVARLARDEGYAVVIRTDRATRVLDDDAVDLTPRVIAELEREAGATQETREPAPAPEEPRPSERRRTRTQSCAGDAVDCVPRDAGS